MNTLKHTYFVIMSPDGWSICDGYVSDKYTGDLKEYVEEMKIAEITTIKNCDTLYITTK